MCRLQYVQCAYVSGNNEIGIELVFEEGREDVRIFWSYRSQNT